MWVDVIIATNRPVLNLIPVLEIFYINSGRRRKDSF